jgi:hypothetical protein
VDPRLIIQLPSGGALERQLDRGALPSGVVAELGPTDAEGNLEASDAGEVVLSVPSPEALARDPDELRRVIEYAGVGVEPLVVEVEAAEELRDDELSAVLHATDHAPRPVILRIVRNV